MLSPLITREDTDSDFGFANIKLLMIYSTPQDDKTCGVFFLFRLRYKHYPIDL